MRFYVKQVESAHVNKFSHMSDEELEAFIRDGVAGLDASWRATFALRRHVRLRLSRLGRRRGANSDLAQGSRHRTVCRPWVRHLISAYTQPAIECG